MELMAENIKVDIEKQEHTLEDSMTTSDKKACKTQEARTSDKLEIKKLSLFPMTALITRSKHQRKKRTLKTWIW